MALREDYACPCCKENFADPRLVELVRRIQPWCSENLVITSGYRCKKYNQEVGGADGSAHIHGLAADISCNTNQLRYEIVRAAIHFGIHRIGIYKRHIHVDIAKHLPPRVIWIG